MVVLDVGSIKFLKGQTILERIFSNILYSPPQLDCLQFHAVLERTKIYNIDGGSLVEYDFLQFDTILET